MRTNGKVRLAVIAALVAVALTGCNLDPCAHHGGTRNDNKGTYICNDGTVR